MQQNPKDTPFYERFHQQLLESNTWPGVYIFKFIITSSDADKAILLDLFENDKVTVNVRASSKGKYTSISIAGKFRSPDVIIQKHKLASKIPNIIQL
ncbi:MAG: hypothetical protein CMC82_07550 [Flavobacteriaceae bacterium]|nr:hypothetical protein [Flavobacteriaceae bacterium]|tara:strand:- start:254 stop:544 length:291 start_codon:yes stop_codon:yes gene_type:complete